MGRYNADYCLLAILLVLLVLHCRWGAPLRRRPAIWRTADRARFDPGKSKRVQLSAHPGAADSHRVRPPVAPAEFPPGRAESPLALGRRLAHRQRWSPRGELPIDPPPMASVYVNDLPYRGNYRLRLPAAATFDVVNDVESEVISRAFWPASFSRTGIDETYKAQAIVARTYALYELKRPRPAAIRRCIQRSAQPGLRRHVGRDRHAPAVTSGHDRHRRGLRPARTGAHFQGLFQQLLRRRHPIRRRRLRRSPQPRPCRSNPSATCAMLRRISTGARSSLPRPT